MGGTLTTNLYTCHVTRDGGYAPAAFSTSPEENCVNHLKYHICRVDKKKCDAERIPDERFNK